jgi:hypothetical protein
MIISDTVPRSKCKRYENSKTCIYIVIEVQETEKEREREREREREKERYPESYNSSLQHLELASLREPLTSRRLAGYFFTM